MLIDRHTQYISEVNKLIGRDTRFSENRPKSCQKLGAFDGPLYAITGEELYRPSQKLDKRLERVDFSTDLGTFCRCDHYGIPVLWRSISRTYGETSLPRKNSR